jgi:hypothetical protein
MTRALQLWVKGPTDVLPIWNMLRELSGEDEENFEALLPKANLKATPLKAHFKSVSFSGGNRKGLDPFAHKLMFAVQEARRSDPESIIVAIQDEGGDDIQRQLQEELRSQRYDQVILAVRSDKFRDDLERFVVPCLKLEQQLFWRHFGEQLRPQDEVFVAEGYIDAGAVRDIRGRELAAFSGLSGRAMLFFVDRDPRANWAHDCWYVLWLLEERRFVKAQHRMPPPDEVELLKLPR